MTAGISLRAETSEDLPYLRQLYASTREEEMASLPWPSAARQAFVDQQFALQHLHYVRTYVGAEFLVVEAGGKPVGRYYLWRGDGDFLIIDISLDPSVRGQGIGSALIGRIQSTAVGHGCGVRLHVRRDNQAARRLYSRLGFLAEAGGEDDAYLPMRWQPLS